MEVFITWSGPRSKVVAEALRDWLPLMIQRLKPWISLDDIDKGARWRNEISQHLAAAEVGIVVLTPDNLTAPWLLFEAGAVSKNEDRALVYTYLVGLNPSQVAEPLGQFQATVANKEDTKKLLNDVNGRLGSEALEKSVFDETFATIWPRLEETLENLPPPAETPVLERDDTSMLEEILSEVREIRRLREPVQVSRGVVLRGNQPAPSGSLAANPDWALRGNQPPTTGSLTAQLGESANEPITTHIQPGDAPITAHPVTNPSGWTCASCGQANSYGTLACEGCGGPSHG